MIAIPNMDKPEYCRVCHERLKCKQYDGEILHTPDDCPLIEIVQCKDCKYGHKHILKDTYDCDKSDITVFHEADFYCKASERSE